MTKSYPRRRSSASTAADRRSHSAPASSRGHIASTAPANNTNWLYGNWEVTTQPHLFSNLKESETPLPGSAESTRAATSGATSLMQSFRANTAALETAIQVTTRYGAEPDTNAKPTRRRIVHRNEEGNSATLASRAVDAVCEGSAGVLADAKCCRHVCPALCSPADSATSRKRRAERDHEETQEAHAIGKSGFVDFGLPDFNEAGFVLAEESVFTDPALGEVLGFRRVVHRKTSVNRLCWVLNKEQLPPTATVARVQTLARTLPRLDHINVLRCHEICEDAGHLFLNYEDTNCVTLKTALQSPSWNEGQVANAIRQVIAAVAFCNGQSVQHLGWTLHHVLLPVLPPTAVPVPKVFGFGLMGVVLSDSEDRSLWSPEALEKKRQIPPTACFVSRLDAATKQSSEAWSLGALSYSVISGRSPFQAATPAESEQLILSRAWRLTEEFDKVDHHARNLIESLFARIPLKRCTADRALRHPWLRGWLRPPAGADKELSHLLEFGSRPLPARLFARFLVQFFDPQHFLAIAIPFAQLDQDGDGVISLHDLQAVLRARNEGFLDPGEAARLEQSYQWLLAEDGRGCEAPGVSLTRFAESRAEDVIDGRALRHAFESLDEDGSEEISPHELFEALQQVDCRGEVLCMQDVLTYIASMEEKEAAGDTGLKGGVVDGAIDFEEFELFFPVRVARMRALAARADESVLRADELVGKFETVRCEIDKWLSTLADELEDIREYGQRRHIVKKDAQSLKDAIKRVDIMLRCPPGPKTAVSLKTAIYELQKASRAIARALYHGQYGSTANKKGKTLRVMLEYNYDDFLQVQAIQEMWPTLLGPDMRLARQSVSGTSTARAAGANISLDEDCDPVRALEAAESTASKLEELLAWATAQNLECASMVDALSAREGTAPVLSRSGRGLQPHEHCTEWDDVAEAQATTTSFMPLNNEACGEKMLDLIREFTIRSA